MTTCGLRPGSEATVYGRGPRAIATSPGDRRTGSPESNAIHDSPRTCAISDSGASSWMRIDQGGCRIERSRKAPRARGPSSSAASGSMG